MKSRLEVAKNLQNPTGHDRSRNVSRTGDRAARLKGADDRSWTWWVVRCTKNNRNRFTSSSKDAARAAKLELNARHTFGQSTGAKICKVEPGEVTPKYDSVHATGPFPRPRLYLPNNPRVLRSRIL